MKLYIKDKEFTWPKDSCFCIMAREGLFKCRNNMFTRSCVLVNESGLDLDGLLPQEEFCFLRYTKIPRKIMEDALSFFAETARKHSAEAIVLLGYDIVDRRWLSIVPEQTSGGMEVKYTIPDDLDDHILLPGDIHSHVDAGAFHSSTDTHDEKMRDGIHITLGKVQNKWPDISMEIVQDGKRFTLTEDMILEEWGPRSTRVPDGWMDKFTYKKWEWKGNRHAGKHHIEKHSWEDWHGYCD